MEQREVCIDFLKGSCELKENCQKGHIEIDNVDKFLQEFEEKSKIKNRPFEVDEGRNYLPNYSKVATISGKKIVVNICKKCGKGFQFNSEIFPPGSKESICCTNCINAEDLEFM